VARRIEQVECEPLVLEALKLITAEEAAMPCSAAVQLERTGHRWAAG
jgi:hypothetical protein